eukprot:1048185-Pyramimonas_sp.AAC.1
MGLQLARLECDAMAAAAHYCDLGLAEAGSTLPDALLAPTRACLDPAPRNMSGPGRLEGAIDPVDDEIRARSYR